MVTISISAAAFASIAAMLPKGSKAEARPDGKGAYLVTLDRNVLDRSPIAARAGRVIRMSSCGWRQRCVASGCAGAAGWT